MGEINLDESSLTVAYAVVAFVIGAMTGFIARSKGRSFLGWWIYGALISPVALLHVLLARPNQAPSEQRIRMREGRRHCPYCGEWVKRDLEVCPECWRSLPAEDAPAEEDPTKDEPG
jgi:hypothetical protein